MNTPTGSNMAETIKGIVSTSKDIAWAVGIIIAGTVAFVQLQGSVASAQTGVDGNSANLAKVLNVIQKQNDRQIEVERKQAILEYRVQEDTATNKGQTKQLQHQTKVLERIATKLQVRTD